MLLNVSMGFDQITKCKNIKQYHSSTSVRRHGLEIIRALQFKTQQQPKVQRQIQKFICDQWKDDIFEYFGLMPQLTTMNTQVLQSVAGCADHKWRNVVKLINDYLGKKLFASDRNKQILRKLMKPVSLKTFKIRLQRESQNIYNPRNNKDFFVSSIAENEIIPQCFENFVNRNEWVWKPSKFGFSVWNQIGMDKATKGGYNESIALVAGKFSVKNSMCSIHVPGVCNCTLNEYLIALRNLSQFKLNFIVLYILRLCFQTLGEVQESQKNIQSIFERIDNEYYNKSAMWSCLGKKPVLVAIVKFATNKEQIVVSRLCHASLVCIAAHKQNDIDLVESKADIEVIANNANNVSNPIPICMDQFVNEAFFLENAQQKKHFKNKWSESLDQIRSFDQSYARPKDLGYMSEMERLGKFNGSLYPPFVALKLNYSWLLAMSSEYILLEQCFTFLIVCCMRI